MSPCIMVLLRLRWQLVSKGVLHVFAVKRLKNARACFYLLTRYLVFWWGWVLFIVLPFQKIGALVVIWVLFCYPIKGPGGSHSEGGRKNQLLPCWVKGETAMNPKLFQSHLSSQPNLLIKEPRCRNQRTNTCCIGFC